MVRMKKSLETQENKPSHVVGETYECSGCGETLVRMTDHEREVASGSPHGCWNLPPGAEHIRLD